MYRSVLCQTFSYARTRTLGNLPMLVFQVLSKIYIFLFLSHTPSLVSQCLIFIPSWREKQALTEELNENFVLSRMPVFDILYMSVYNICILFIYYCSTFIYQSVYGRAYKINLKGTMKKVAADSRIKDTSSIHTWPAWLVAGRKRLLEFLFWLSHSILQYALALDVI